MAIVAAVVFVQVQSSPLVRVRRAVDKRDFRALKEFLGHSDANVRFFAANGLGEVHTQEAKEFLVRSLYNERDEYVRVTIASSILKSKQADEVEKQSAIKTIQRHLDSSMPAVRRHAIDCLCSNRALGEWSIEDEVRNVVLRMSTDDEYDLVRASAFKCSVRFLEVKDQASLIRKAIADPSEVVRYAAWNIVWHKSIDPDYVLEADVAEPAEEIADTNSDSSRINELVKSILSNLHRPTSH
ncbi:HEAT repeat domain-containing protein [Thalassoglobus sp. JC818]|uniref:HEAT repeat domain-containing protein n=1 Tax=Thalassoglobus sp. JC818 TaxID=3232136 RepID=UPI003459E26F